MSQPFERGGPARAHSLVDRWIDEVVPQELDWKELVRAYPIPAVLAVAAGGFYLGAVHGRRIVETLGDLVTQRVEDTAERLHGAARRRDR
jgi:hypothetical protein